MYINFTDMNKAFPRDNYQLPYIDQMADATTGHEMLNFMDAYYE